MDIENEVSVLLLFMLIALVIFQDRNRFVRFLPQLIWKRRQRKDCIHRCLKTVVQAGAECKTKILLTGISVHIHLSWSSFDWNLILKILNCNTRQANFSALTRCRSPVELKLRRFNLATIIYESIIRPSALSCKFYWNSLSEVHMIRPFPDQNSIYGWTGINLRSKAFPNVKM